MMLIIKTKNHQIEINHNENITFKIQYNINIKDSKIIPSDFKYSDDLEDKTEAQIIKMKQLTNLYYFFKLIQQKSFKENHIIFLYPKENVQIIKTSRFKVDKVFFISRGVSENNAIKSAKIFNDHQKTYSQCLKELKRIYVGSAFNLQFYSQAIPKLIAPN